MKIKEETIEKWRAILDSDYEIATTSGTSFDSVINTSTLENFSLLPLVKKIFATTISDGGWIKSKKQQLKEDRINKLRKVQGLEPNVELEKDEYVSGLIPVQPLSAPLGGIFYTDFKYETKKEERRKKLKRLQEIKGGIDFIENLQLNIIRKDKLEFINKILKNDIRT